MVGLASADKYKHASRDQIAKIHDMASNREERRLQRQRGAQRHQVQDVDFGSPFPTAAVSQRITRSGPSPQPDLHPHLSSRRTPATRGRGTASSSRSTQKQSTPTPVSTENDASRSANTSAKRRKLDTTQDEQLSSPERTTRSRTTPRAQLPDPIEEEPAAESVERQTIDQSPEGNSELAEELDQVQLMQTPRSRHVTNMTATRADEVTESPRYAPGSGQRQQVPVETPRIPGVRLFGNPGEPIPMAQMTDQNAGPFTRLAYRRSPRNREEYSAGDAVDELSPDRPDSSRLEFQPEQFSDVAEEEETEAIDDVEVAPRLAVKRKRKSNVEEMEFEVEAEEPEHDEEEQEGLEPSPEPFLKPTKAVKQKKLKEKASPAAQRQPRTKAKSKSTSRRTGEKIPVIVHRLTKPIQYGEDDTDADLLNEDIPFAKRSGVNTVDVLSQFCEEVIESGLAALEEGGSNAEDTSTRKEYRTKLRAVEAFQEELRTRLLELTVILDADYLLNKRVKAAQKEKIDLRDNLLRLRAERERLALRMDEVRIKHENSSREAQEQVALSTTLNDIELAVSRGLEQAPVGDVEMKPPVPDLSILLRDISGKVSSNSPEGGILKQVKDFNAFLERAALALEARQP